MQQFDKFTQAYIKCALWASLGDHDEPLDKNYGVGDIAHETLQKMKKDCEEFQRNNLDDLLELDASHSGHDFWLSRNGHGAGFFDRGYGEVGDRLQKAAKVYGTFDLYVGDDGLIYGG